MGAGHVPSRAPVRHAVRRRARSGRREVHALPVPAEGFPVPAPRLPDGDRRRRSPRYLPGYPVHPLRLGRLDDRGSSPLGRPPYASLEPLPYGAPAPRPVYLPGPSTPMSAAPPAALPARRRARRKTPSTCTSPRGLSRYREGSFPDAPRGLHPVPGPVSVALRRAGVRRGRPQRTVRRHPWSAPGSTAPVPLQEVLLLPRGTVRSPPERRSRSVAWTGSPSSPPPGPLITPSQCPLPTSQYVRGGSLRISIALEPSTPRRRTTPGA